MSANSIPHQGVLSALLNPSFLAPYESRQPQWGTIGQVVFYRTYSRWLEAERRRERWGETLKRVVEYSLSLDPGLVGETAQKEAEGLYDALWNMRVFAAGRTLWVGGTEHAKTSALSQFNCSYTNVESVGDFKDLCTLLMNGCGVGLGVRAEQVAKFKAQGELSICPTVIVNPYNYVGQPSTQEKTTSVHYSEKAAFRVGDSREGWAEFVSQFLWAYLFTPELKLIQVDLNLVRPLGERLKTFGGKASGPGALQDFVEGVVSTFTRTPEITDVTLLDVCNLVGRMVVSGGVRRSAELLLGDASSTAFTETKTGNWWESTPWRNQSNNSIVFMEQPDSPTLRKIFEKVLQFGEPGFFNGEAASRKKLSWSGSNPCGEILMRSRQFCNLVSINLGYYAANPWDSAQLMSDTALITRHNLRITNCTATGVHPDWDLNQKQDRLLGVSITGYGDLADAWDNEGMILALLKSLRILERTTADEYADQMGIPRPELISTVKPEGSLTLLYGSSSGLHDAYAPYYLRRVRVSRTDAVASTLRGMGVPWQEAAGDKNTLVFAFPVKSHATQKASDKSAVQQLERYFAVMKAYVDHNASVTIQIAPEEVVEVVHLLSERWDEYVGVSFLQKNDTGYVQAPLEAITEQEYQRLMSHMPDLNYFADWLEMVEVGGMTAGDDLEDGCLTGACPVR